MCYFDASVATEELGHVEMVSTLLYQLTKDLDIDAIKATGFDKYFVDHTLGIYPTSAGGVPFDALTFASTGDVIADLFEDMSAEQKARLSYDNILRLVDDEEVCKVIEFLRQREINHFQRFGDILTRTQEQLNSSNYYAFNPEFDKCKM